MYLLYSILLTIGVIVLLPRFVVDAFRHGKYVTGLGQRLGNVPILDRHDHPVIWLHCVSVGEAQAARPLVKELRQRFPLHRLVISTTTLTGQRVANDAYRDDAALVIYFPFDWAWTVRRSLNAIRPSIVLIMETELWPNFLRECRRREIITAVVNGRISERSFKRLRIVSGFVSRMVNELDLALMQTDVDAERMCALGLETERVKITGNIKFDGVDDGKLDELTFVLQQRFGYCDGRPLVVAASTHGPEERISLDALKAIRQTADSRTTRLLIAPRHPERFAETVSLVRTSGFSWTKRSDQPDVHDKNADVVILDSIGELRSVYPLADVVFVGGSIAPFGGHNVLEPITAGKSVIIGANTSNFSAIVNAFTEIQALVQLPSLTDHDATMALAESLQELLYDVQSRENMATRASELLEKSRGATKRTVDFLAPLFGD